MKASDFIAAGDLKQALAAAQEEVKKNPGEHIHRWHYAELLCFAGDLAKADKQLETILVQEARLAVNVAEFRHLIRAELSRREVFTAGRMPEFVGDCTPAARHCLEALAALQAGDELAAQKSLQEAEQARPRLSGECDGQPIDDLRELDDLLGPVCEVYTQRGDCAWLPLELVSRLTFAKPERPRDLLWRPANVVLQDEQELPVHVPVLYADSYLADDDHLRLGRSTRWQGEGVTRGVGQRMWLLGNEAKGILEVSDIKLAAQ